MSLSWTIGKIFRIPVRLHATMLLVPYLAFSYLETNSVLGQAIALGFAVALFASILAHEFGHALTARRFGIETKDIILTPLGGMARVARMPKNPKQEIAISIAGPLVSFAIAALGLGIGFVSASFTQSALVIFASGVLIAIGWANLVLGVFNLVPALPMDGGRVLRGLLALKYDHLKATRLAARVGKFIAIAMGIYAITNGQISLGLIAMFVYFSAGSEVRMAEFQEYQARMARGGQPAGPFPGTYRPKVWKVQVGQNGQPFGAPGGPASLHNEEPGAEQKDYDNWQQPSSHDSKPIVVEGGKVKILGRNKTDKDS